MRQLAVLGGACLAVLVVVGGCTFGKSSGQAGRMTYNLPTKLTISAGSELPGTGIRYVCMGQDGAEVSIQGQQALKRKGDSLDWGGKLIPGVSIDLKQRVVWYTEKELHLVGTAKIVVDDTAPQASKTGSKSPVKYSGPVVYSVARGSPIPGSTVTFDDRTTDGAKLGGIEGYPYRKGGDSILWEGTLREGVYIRLDVRVLQFDSKAMRVGGLVTLWIGS
jgi:hypothetical protein